MQRTGFGIQPNEISSTPRLQHRVSPRQPLANLSGNNPGLSGFAGYGMSAGLKVSNPAVAANNSMGRPAIISKG